MALESFLSWLDTGVDTLHSMGAATCFMQTSYTETVFSDLSKTISLPEIQIKVALALLSSYPLALLFKMIRYPMHKHIFSTIAGVCIFQLVYGPDWIHSFVSSALSYLFMITLPPTVHPYVVFAFAMTYLVLAHINNMRVAYLVNAFDFSRSQMMLTIKITAFAFNMADAQLDKTRISVPPSAREPSFSVLEYFGFIYCFCGGLIGPAFEFRCYYSCIVPRTSTDTSSKTPPTKTGRRVEHAMQALSLGVFWLVLFVTVSKSFPLKRLSAPEFIAKHNVVYRWGFAVIALFSERCKFYFGWKVAEGSCILAGFGLESPQDPGAADAGPPFADVRNVDVLSYETGSCISQLTRYWNKSTQTWLQKYTYEKSGKSFLATYVVSALWHGLYPGFFLFFFSFAFATVLERSVRAKINPRLLDAHYTPKRSVWAQWGQLSVVCRSYIFLCALCTAVYTNYVTVIFNGLSFDNCVLMWGSFYYFGHIAVCILLGILMLLPSTRQGVDQRKPKVQ